MTELYEYIGTVYNKCLIYFQEHCLKGRIEFIETDKLTVPDLPPGEVGFMWKYSTLQFQHSNAKANVVVCFQHFLEENFEVFYDMLYGMYSSHEGLFIMFCDSIPLEFLEKVKQKNKHFLEQLIVVSPSNIFIQKNKSLLDITNLRN